MGELLPRVLVLFALLMAPGVVVAQGDGAVPAVGAQGTRNDVVTPAETAPAVRWWETPPWKRAWVLIAATAGASAVTLGVVLAPMLVAGSTAVGMGGAAFFLINQIPGGQVGYSLLYVAMGLAVGALAVGGLGAAVSVPALILARSLAATFVPWPDEDGFRVSRLDRARHFVLPDAVAHVGLSALALILGVIQGVAATSTLAFLAVIWPYAFCLPFCVPAPQLLVSDDLGVDNGLLNFTALPVIAALYVGGLFAGGLVAAQVGVPLFSLVQLERAGVAAPDDEPADDDDEDLDETLD